jgi:hypothetical protein
MVRCSVRRVVVPCWWLSAGAQAGVVGGGGVHGPQTTLLVGYDFWGASPSDGVVGWDVRGGDCGGLLSCAGAVNALVLSVPQKPWMWQAAAALFPNLPPSVPSRDVAMLVTGLLTLREMREADARIPGDHRLGPAVVGRPAREVPGGVEIEQRGEDVDLFSPDGGKSNTDLLNYLDRVVTKVTLRGQTLLTRKAIKEEYEEDGETKTRERVEEYIEGVRGKNIPYPVLKRLMQGVNTAIQKANNAKN